MELSESVQRGLQSLADPSSFDLGGFQALLDAAARGLLSGAAEPGVLGEPLPPPLPPSPSLALSLTPSVLCLSPLPVSPSAPLPPPPRSMHRFCFALTPLRVNGISGETGSCV